MPPEFSRKYRSGITLDAVSPLRKYVSWAGMAANLFVLLLFIGKVTLMMIDTYSAENAIYVKRAGTLIDCGALGPDKSEEMQAFCDIKEKAHGKSPIERTIGETADRLYWGTIASIQALLSSTYTLVFVALLSAIGGFYVSARGILDWITPPCLKGSPPQVIFAGENGSIVLGPSPCRSIKTE